jgi:hypothetical protein
MARTTFAAHLVQPVVWRGRGVLQGGPDTVIMTLSTLDSRRYLENSACHAAAMKVALMKIIKVAVSCLTLLFVVLLAACNSNKQTKSLGIEEAVSTAVDAYLYGYPLITFDVARAADQRGRA